MSRSNEKITRTSWVLGMFGEVPSRTSGEVVQIRGTTDLIEAARASKIEQAPLCGNCREIRVDPHNTIKQERDG